jgi:hypothetical protein
MLITDFHREFKISLDKVDSSAYPELMDGEIDFFLNEAQLRFVKTRYGINNLYRKGFEEIQKRIDDLNNLVKTRFTNIALYPYSGNSYKADVNTLFVDELRATPSTDKYMFFLKMDAKVSKTCGASYPNYCTHIQQDDLARAQKDPFNKPTDDFPIFWFEDGGLVVQTGGSPVTAVRLTFLKFPNAMCLGTYGKPVSQCELAEHTHKEIIQLAVKIALENLESPRQQTQDSNLQNLE